MMTSWRTTILGICTIVGTLCTVAVALFDGNPETQVNIEEVITAIVAVLVGMGLLAARDNKVTSEQAGANNHTAIPVTKKDSP